MGDLPFERIPFPLMVPVRQRIASDSVGDPGAEAAKELARIGFSAMLRRGERVGITVGSRGIARMGELVRALVAAVREAGGQPFLLASMGSHGGGTAEGQLDVLRSLGIDEERVGAPVRACAESRRIGTTGSGIPVFVNREALERAHRLVLFNRVKSHTEYHGSIESGILKMSAIGLGGPEGAKTVHEFALDRGYERAIVEVGSFVMRSLPVACALAVVENYYHEISRVKAILPERVLDEERDLLKIAKADTGRIPYDRLDLLIVEEIGKNVSGAGMDTQVVGRTMVYGQPEPEKPDIKRIVVLDMTEESHGNAIGIGLADYTVKRVIDKIDRVSTALNCITAQTPEKGRVPIWFETDREAVRAALVSIGSVRPGEARVVHIKNTEEVKHLRASEALMDETRGRDDLEILGGPSPMGFDERGNLSRIPAFR